LVLVVLGLVLQVEVEPAEELVEVFGERAPKRLDLGVRGELVGEVRERSARLEAEMVNHVKNG